MPGLQPEPSSQSPSAEPSPGAVTDELLRILSSDVFAGAARQQRLLRHLVEKRLQGSPGDLKEYTLGVEVFDRGEDFDPRLDPIVRVEASRLRSRLQKYYDAAGTADPVRITLPRGAYIPSFAYPEAAAATVPEPAAASTQPAVEFPPVEPAAPPVRKNRFLWPAVAAAVAVAIGFAIWAMRGHPTRNGTPHFLKFQRITTEGLLCTSPSFSPGGDQIAYARRNAGIWELYERNLKTSAVTELTPESSYDNRQPAWSPDGKEIAFRSERDGGGIFLLNTKTRAISRLTSFGYYPSWSPDSKRIVVSTASFNDPVESPSNGASELKIIDAATGKDLTLTTTAKVPAPLQPAWSPNGKRIAFWSTDTNGDRDIYTVSVDRGEVRPVTQDAWTDWSPVWSPDGRYLYFSSDRAGSMNLWRVRVDEDSGAVSGSPEPVTTPSSYSGWIAFAPNGDTFAYVNRIPFSELYRAPFSDTKGVDVTRKVQLTFGERSMHEPAMAPDGKWIAVRVEDPQEDLALIRPDGSGFRRLTNDRFTERSPKWSPDSKQIVFVSNRSGSFQDWAIGPDGTGLRQLTTDGTVPNAWTPDGVLAGYPANRPPFAIEPRGHTLKSWGLPAAFRPIAWAPGGGAVTGRMRTSAFGQQSLFIFTAADEDFWEIAPLAPYPSTVWLNSRQVLFSRDDGFYLADLASHNLKRVADTTHSDIRSHFAVAPDGQSLFFIQSDDEEDIWTGSE